MNNFVALMQRAEALRRLETDPLRGEWWAGYVRGLRRAHHGEPDRVVRGQDGDLA